MKDPNQVTGTYCSDPAASHTVSGVQVTPTMRSAGILGYYTNEFDANRAARYFRNNGGFNITVESYDPHNQTPGGIHPLIETYM